MKTRAFCALAALAVVALNLSRCASSGPDAVDWIGIASWGVLALVFLRGARRQRAAV